MVEISAVIGAAYLTFYLAEHFLHVSGVLALVALGIMVGGYGRSSISPKVTHFMKEFWELAGFIANCLIFLIVGLVVAARTQFAASDFITLAIVYIGIHAVRAIVLVIFYPIMNSKLLTDIFNDMRPIKSCDDPRLHELLEIAKWFDNWKNSDSLPSKNKGKLIMSLQCHEDIQSCIIGFTELCMVFLKTSSKIYITPALINSDVIDNTASSTYPGANSNPNLI